MTENNPQDPNYYEDVIDLRELAKTLLKYKWIIVLTTILSAIAAFLFSKFLLTPKYEAIAHIGITHPSFEVDLEPSINNPPPLGDYRVFIEITKPLPEFAEAVEVWLSVCEVMDLTCLGEGNDKPKLKAELLGTSQLKLTVTSEDPERSAEFVNLWAGEIIERWNLYYGSGMIDLIQLEEEVTQSLEAWNTAQKALEDYLPESQVDVAEVQLSHAKEELARYLNEIESNEGIIRDADFLDVRLSEQGQLGKLLIGDALSLVGLLQRTSGGVSGTQFQISGTDIYGQEYTVADARKILTGLVSAMETQNEDIEIHLVALEGEINYLALEWETERNKIRKLELERDRAQNTYQALAGYLDETVIALEYNGQAAYYAARAVVPQETSGQPTIVLVALAIIVGLVLSTGGVFVFSWWTSEEESV